MQLRTRNTFDFKKWEKIVANVISSDEIALSFATISTDSVSGLIIIERCCFFIPNQIMSIISSQELNLVPVDPYYFAKLIITLTKNKTDRSDYIIHAFNWIFSFAQEKNSIEVYYMLAEISSNVTSYMVIPNIASFINKLTEVSINSSIELIDSILKLLVSLSIDDYSIRKTLDFSYRIMQNNFKITWFQTNSIMYPILPYEPYQISTNSMFNNAESSIIKLSTASFHSCIDYMLSFFMYSKKIF